MKPKEFPSPDRRRANRGNLIAKMAKSKILRAVLFPLVGSFVFGAGVAPGFTKKARAGGDLLFDIAGESVDPAATRDAVRKVAGDSPKGSDDKLANEVRTAESVQVGDDEDAEKEECEREKAWWYQRQKEQD